MHIEWIAAAASVFRGRDNYCHGAYKFRIKKLNTLDHALDGEQWKKNEMEYNTTKRVERWTM